MKLLIAVGLVVACGCFVFACTPQEGKKDKGEEKKAFEPGEMELYENEEFGFSIMKPKNVEISEKKAGVELVAEGFPLIGIYVRETKDSGTGASGGLNNKEVRWKVLAYKRELVCECSDVGEFTDLVMEICKSLQSTALVKKQGAISWSKPEIEGTLEDADAYKKAVLALEPKVLECWTQALEKDSTFSAGDISFVYNRAADGTDKGRTITGSFYKGDYKVVSECVAPLIETVAIEPVDGEVKVVWMISFELK